MMSSVIVAMLLVFLCTLSFLNPTSASGNPRLLAKERPLVSEPLSSWRQKAQYGLKYEDNRISHVALYHTHRGRYYGTEAKIGIWGSQNQGHLQESGTSIMLASNGLLDFSAIEAGFHVYPNLYNDSNVHFFILWTKDNYKSTGCINLKCEGFVLASEAVLVPGQKVAPESTYDEEQHYISIRLNMDPVSGDWVLYQADDADKPVKLGYFPAALVPNLIDVAPRVAWTGFTSYPFDQPGPPMGSGHFPDEDNTKGSTIDYIKIFDKAGNAQEPARDNFISVVDLPDCYKISGVNSKSGFSYGGPGGCIG